MADDIQSQIANRLNQAQTSLNQAGQTYQTLSGGGSGGNMQGRRGNWSEDQRAQWQQRQAAWKAAHPNPTPNNNPPGNTINGVPVPAGYRPPNPVQPQASDPQAQAPNIPPPAPNPPITNTPNDNGRMPSAIGPQGGFQGMPPEMQRAIMLRMQRQMANGPVPEGPYLRNPMKPMINDQGMLGMQMATGPDQPIPAFGGYTPQGTTPGAIQMVAGPDQPYTGGPFQYTPQGTTPGAIGMVDGPIQQTGMNPMQAQLAAFKARMDAQNQNQGMVANIPSEQLRQLIGMLLGGAAQG